MPLKAAMWVPGTIVEAENPGPWINMTRAGWGTHFRMRKMGNWFHVPLTTPVVLDDVRPKLVQAFLLFSTKGNATITRIHFYDGPNNVKQIENLSLQGDHKAIDAMNRFIIDPPLTVLYSLGISVNVMFGETAQVVPEVVFYSVGGDFRT